MSELQSLHNAHNRLIEIRNDDINKLKQQQKTATQLAVHHAIQHANTNHQQAINIANNKV